VKPYMAMNVCTNEDQSTCYIQPPIYLYEFDNVEKTFNELKDKITNPDQYIIPILPSYLTGDFNNDRKRGFGICDTWRIFLSSWRELQWLVVGQLYSAK